MDDHISIKPLSRRTVQAKIRSFRRGRISIHEKSERYVDDHISIKPLSRRTVQAKIRSIRRGRISINDPDDQ